MEGLQERRRPTLPPGVAVPSARTGAPSPWPPWVFDIVDIIMGQLKRGTRSPQVKGAFREKTKVSPPYRPLAGTGRGTCAQAQRAISTTRLRTLLPLHLWPINVVISHGPLKKSHLVAGFALICFQRLSNPDIATQRCPWRDNWCTSGRSDPVLSY